MAMKKNYLRCAIIFIFGNAQLTFYHQYKNQCMLLILEVFFLIFTHHDAKPRFPLLIKYYDTTDLDKNADIYTCAICCVTNLIHVGERVGHMVDLIP